MDHLSKKEIYSPSHYQVKGLEPYQSIDIIKAVLNNLDLEPFESYCAGNVLKYLIRFSKKNGVEDLEKCEVYHGWLKECYSERLSEEDGEVQGI